MLFRSIFFVGMLAVGNLCLAAVYSDASSDSIYSGGTKSCSLAGESAEKWTLQDLANELKDTTKYRWMELLERAKHEFPREDVAGLGITVLRKSGQETFCPILPYAIAEGYGEPVKMLIRYFKCNVNGRYGECQITPLMVLARARAFNRNEKMRNELAQLMMSCGADPRMRMWATIGSGTDAVQIARDNELPSDFIKILNKRVRELDERDRVNYEQREQLRAENLLAQLRADEKAEKARKKAEAAAEKERAERRKVARELAKAKKLEELDPQEIGSIADLGE